MYEVELKVETVHEGLPERLDSLGATRERRVEQTDTYYDAPHRDFAETDEALRIRRERPLDAEATDPESDPTVEVTLTYKGPLVDDSSKTRREHETGVDDAAELAAVLDGIGFEPAATVEKERTFYAVDGYTVVLDSVAGLGEFVEIERRAAADDVDSVREGAVGLLESLGLDPDDGIRTSYLGLLLEEERRR